MNNKLRELRLEMGLTQKDLAKKLGSTDKNIWAYEKGIAMPPYDVLSAYADCFGVTTDYLLGRTDDFGTSIAAPMGSVMVDSLTADERELVTKYRKLSPDLKAMLKGIIGTWTGETDPIPQSKIAPKA